MSIEELRQVRDTLIEALRRSDTLTLEGRALFRRYAAMTEALTGTAPVEGPAQPGPAAAPAPPAVPATAARRSRPTEEDEEFGGSFMVRSNPAQQAPYREAQPQQPQADLPRSLRARRR
ncbi:hypothetical protein [Actinophytocola sp.]|uniref:hypothetical protein n=1 Tax=Actinophytocola sp. TaxID=1872138 RepID=UPI002ED1B736